MPEPVGNEVFKVIMDGSPCDLVGRDSEPLGGNRVAKKNGAVAGKAKHAVG